MTGTIMTAAKMLDNTMNSRLRDVSHELFNISTELHKIHELLLKQEERTKESSMCAEARWNYEKEIDQILSDDRK